MYQKFDKITFDSEDLHKVIRKYNKCPQAVHFFGQMGCKIFMYNFDNVSDIMHHCGTCKWNIDEPNHNKFKARLG
jgi:hypothetical protein